MNTVTVLSRLHRLVGGSSSFHSQLVRGGAASALIQVVNRLLALGLGVVLARGLGTEGYGIYAYAFALMTLLMVFADLGMPTLLMREVAANQASHDWPRLHGVVVGAFNTKLKL